MYSVITAILTILIVTFSFDVRANDDSFSYRTDEVNIHLEPLMKLELLHKSFPDKTFQELIEENDLDSYSYTNASKIQTGFSEPMPIIPAFWWGCILGWVGILVVFLVTQDSLQTQNALWGCIVGTLLSCVFYGLIILNTGFTIDFLTWFR